MLKFVGFRKSKITKVNHVLNSKSFNFGTGTPLGFVYICIFFYLPHYQSVISNGCQDIPLSHCRPIPRQTTESNRGNNTIGNTISIWSPKILCFILVINLSIFVLQNTMLSGPYFLLVPTIINKIDFFRYLTITQFCILSYVSGKRRYIRKN